MFAKRCEKVLYSSNRDDFVRPFELALSDAARPRVRALPIGVAGHFLARSLSADCELLALVSPVGAGETYDVYLYRLRTAELENLTATPSIDEGSPEFSPTGKRLAFLADGALVLHDVATGRRVRLPPQPARFLSFCWSEDGGALYLEDARTDLWQLELEAERFSKLWEAPRPSYSRRALHHARGTLYFISDHESPFTQVYALDLSSGAARRLFAAPHDQASPRSTASGDVLFRMSADASFSAYRLHGGEAVRLSPERGVVYDFSLDFGNPLLHYAGDEHPLSLYAAPTEGALRELLSLPSAVAQTRARIERNVEGMANLVYLPDGEPAGWVVWLHGGPQENVSPRFNPYFALLLRSGLAVVALNYPGSTGMGNGYELRDLPREQWIERQVGAVLRDLEAIRARHPGLRSYVLVGVSYGSTVAHAMLARGGEEVTGLVDFSGMAMSSGEEPAASGRRHWPPALFVYGTEDPVLTRPARRALLETFARHAPTERLEIRGEGHFILRRTSVASILLALRRFARERATLSSNPEAPGERKETP